MIPSRSDDRALATVVGAIMVIAIMGSAVLYVNAFHVPKQGHRLEVDTRADAQRALLSLSQRLSGDPEPIVHELPLKGAASAPPLLSGVILTPARANGELLFQPGAALATISHVTNPPLGWTAPATPSDDPTREAVAGDRMRVYLVGGTTGGRALGSVQLGVGGAYLEPATYSLEGGAVFVRREGASGMIAPPSLHVSDMSTATEPITGVAWRVPLLVGTLGQVGGRESAQVSLAPGPLARAGGGERVYETRITIQTDALGAWTEALKAAVGPGLAGNVTSVSTGTDAGTVSVVIGDAAQTLKTIMVDYSAVRYSVQLTARADG